MNVTPEQAAEILQIIQAKYPREFENGFLTWRLAMAERALAAGGPQMPQDVEAVAGQVMPAPEDKTPSDGNVVALSDGKEPT